MNPIADRRAGVLREALSAGLLHPDRAPIASFIDGATLRENVESLRRAFAGGPDVLHAFAAKAGSLPVLLRMLRELGMGAEVASEGEFEMALRAGFAGGEIVFDSPAKTNREIERALACGAQINIDNLQEFERIARRLGEGVGGDAIERSIGFRVNPQIGTGSIEAMSTAGAQSKFGVGIRDAESRSRVLEAYLRAPWMNSVHVHVGSQGVASEMMVEGIREVTALADEINGRVGAQRILTIDIGGGLPVDFQSDDGDPGFERYAAALRSEVPRLFSGDYRIVTEFGRSILAKAGFMAAFVEYTKSSGGRPIAVTHAGAHVATRTVFMPDSWPLRILPFTGSGEPKTGGEVVQDVAGPCCFAGDLIARGRSLARLDAGDIVVVPDTGAYYASTPFTYNSILAPGIYAAEWEGAGDGAVGFRPVRAPQTMASLLAASGAELLG